VEKIVTALSKNRVCWQKAIRGILFLSFLITADSARAFQEPAALPSLYESRIQPILAAHCYRCHGQNRHESNYRLDVRELALGSGDRGESPIVPGNADASPLIAMITGSDGEQMPPDDEGKPLDAEAIEAIRQWIDEGAEWPDELAGSAESRPETDHWSFQRPQEPVVPAPRAAGGSVPPSNEIDRFILESLRQEGLEFSERADRATLLRRLYLVMLGLLPTPQQVTAFVNDPSDDAWEKQVDAVLDSPHYGERWARHWLDLVRFGESTGYEVNRDRSNAWWYRDYVIDAFNSDKPYSKFICEQLAGDVLGVDEATGFLVGGPNDIVKSPDPGLTLMQRQDELADYVNTTSTTFLGLTVACARCHNHKFDPILQKDYFAIQAFFTGIRHGERRLFNKVPPEKRTEILATSDLLAARKKDLDALAASVPLDDSKNVLLSPAVNAKRNSDAFEPKEARFVRFLVKQTSEGEVCLDELEVFSIDNLNVALAESGARATSSGNYSGDPKHQLPHIHDGRFGNNFSWIASSVTDSWVQIELANPAQIVRVDWGRDRLGEFADRLAIEYRIELSVDGENWTSVSDSTRRQPFLVDGKEPEDAFISRLPTADQPAARQLLDEVRMLREKASDMESHAPMAYAGYFVSSEPVRRLHRGDPISPREVVSPDILSVLGSLSLDPQISESRLRLSLAEWIASPDNPLTARVMANRLWQWHFGRGLVATPSDFGVNGVPPTHPDLLDWLALRFMENGWSLKWLHRKILLSETWCQSARPQSKAKELDADCRLLWRFAPRRLEAEAIRDCVLQASGKLDLRAGGPGFLLFHVDRENVHHYFPLTEFSDEHFRRMIYTTKIRQEQDDVFDVFDCPDGGQTIPVRNRSTTPLQALNLFNSTFVNQRAANLAALATGNSPATRDQLRFLYNRVFLREPTEAELHEGETFVAGSDLASFCRAMLNANEFLFVY
jgi:Protein of unknown function (DUF1553)/Protein of unknown function (DUF1549)/Planctomycete cytochrome C